MTPNLNWKELAHLVSRLRPEFENLFVDRIIVPDRPRFSGGYLKGEWGLRLTSRQGEATLIFSVRPRHPYLTIVKGKGPRAATDGTRSAFDLSLAKALKGARLSSIEALPRERIAILWFNGVAPDSRLGLVLVMIPAVPEALLVQAEKPTPPWKIIARTRASGTSDFFELPDASRAPPDVEIRHALLDTPESYTRAIEAGLETEAFDLRLDAARRSIQDLVKRAKDRLRESQKSAEEATREPDWKRYGDLLKSWLPSPPPIQNGRRTLVDYATGEPVEIPSDPKLGPKEQVEKFYQFARRKQRRLEEARTRIQDFEHTLGEWEKLLSSPPAPLDWEALERFESSARISPRAPKAKSEKGAKKNFAWLGKSFLSKDGLPIFVGRNRGENLELTFKHARGNDLWMHVRGRPGAHALIPLSSGKSAPLETLLDAACLAVYYSGGEKWGKTEVDYTFKKHVKRIKGSSEASYTHNKTLIVEPDAQRLKRLLGQSAG